LEQGISATEQGIPEADQGSRVNFANGYASPTILKKLVHDGGYTALN
jgi:hypothetical protein